MLEIEAGRVQTTLTRIKAVEKFCQEDGDVYQLVYWDEWPDFVSWETLENLGEEGAELAEQDDGHECTLVGQVLLRVNLLPLTGRGKIVVVC